MINNTKNVTAALALCTFALSFNAEAIPIDSPIYFADKPTTIIDFETLPDATTVTRSGTTITNEYENIGVLFSSELYPGTYENTDQADTFGRFIGPFKVLARQSGGGSTTSGARYAAGNIYLNTNVSDMRIDFINPVSAFGFYLIDNDFSVARVSAYDATGTRLETVIVPKVSEGGKTYVGIAADQISYVIIDEQEGGKLDSSFIDDLSFVSGSTQQQCDSPLSTTELGNALDMINTLLADPNLSNRAANRLRFAQKSLSKAMALIASGNVPAGLAWLRRTFNQLVRAENRGADTIATRQIIAQEIAYMVLVTIDEVKTTVESGAIDFTAIDQRYQQGIDSIAAEDYQSAVRILIGTHRLLTRTVRRL